MIFVKVLDIPLKSARLMKNGSNLIQCATITSKSTRGESLMLSKGFPYLEKSLSIFFRLFDPTIAKLSNENAKVIAVEGPIAAGKSAFCKALADEFEMKYFPQPSMEDLFILPNGFDKRDYNDLVPENIRTYDHKSFCVDPYTIQAAGYQFDMLYLRFYQYVHAMCHLLNTGQGVILERSFYSDFVFFKAMVENKYIKPQLFTPYMKIMRRLQSIFARPHLIIYLDLPVTVVQERIKTRNYSYEQNSLALTSRYLTSLDKYMKKEYLPDARTSSEILIYDWSDGGNVDVVIDDIENIEFDIMRGDRRFQSWWFLREKCNGLREITTNNPRYFDALFDHEWYHEDEEYFNYLEQKNHVWNNLYKSSNAGKYEEGFNPLVGDSKFKILFEAGHLKPRQPYLLSLSSTMMSLVVTYGLMCLKCAAVFPHLFCQVSIAMARARFLESAGRTGTPSVAARLDTSLAARYAYTNVGRSPHPFFLGFLHRAKGLEDATDKRCVATLTQENKKVFEFENRDIHLRIDLHPLFVSHSKFVLLYCIFICNRH